MIYFSEIRDKQVTRILFISVISAVLLSGCGSAGENVKYKKSMMIRPLEIPRYLDEPGDANQMKIPGVNSGISDNLNGTKQTEDEVSVDMTPPNILDSQ